MLAIITESPFESMYVSLCIYCLVAHQRETDIFNVLLSSNLLIPRKKEAIN